MGLNREEQVTLAVLGGVALLGLTVLLWQRQRTPLTIETGSASGQTQSSLDSTSWDETLRAARQVDVNTASVGELERLPEVGPALARRIVEYREAHGPFHRPEDLTDVTGIGPHTYDVLKPYLAEDSTK